MNDVTVVIRHVGERTRAVCRRLLEELVNPEVVVEVSEQPFSRAVRRTFEIGISQGRPWTLAVDADVLIDGPAVEKLLGAARSAPDATFEVQGRVLDKLFGGPRNGGPHIFRTSLLPQALDMARQEPESIRPESLVVRAMAQAGHPFLQLPAVVGLHDFEQAYGDLYRKAFVHALKHRFCVPLFKSYWSRHSLTDPDLQVCLWGLRAGQIFERGPVDADARRFPDEIEVLLSARGWSEKKPLDPGAIVPQQVADRIARHRPPPEYERMEGALTGRDPRESWLARLRAARSQLPSSYRLAPWLVGMGLEKVGRQIRRWAQSAS